MIALAGWVIIIAGYWWYSKANALSPIETTRDLISYLSISSLALPIYIAIYMLRPVVFFPATLVTMAAGFLYGPFWGIVYALIASNLSSLMAYLIGRFFGSSFLSSMTKFSMVGKYSERLYANGFETTLVLRFLFLPYDLVSYFSGFLRIDWRQFLLATILGSVPGTISFGLLGASLEGDFTHEIVGLDPLMLIGAAVMFVFSIGLYRVVKHRESRHLRSESISPEFRKQKSPKTTGCW
ncbi:MAG: TVP38/TMEM64 family protein [Chloroflexota bacterium]